MNAMGALTRFDRLKAIDVPRRDAVALLAYVGILAVLASLAVAMAFNLVDAYAALADNQDKLARLERASPRASAAGSSTDAAVGALAFLRGKTVTIAGAALQARVEAAVKKVDGKVLSSQIDLQGPRAAEGFVGFTGNLELDQAALQPLLYDLESGAPFLFVDSLAIQSPQSVGDTDGGRMRVVIGVTGQWRETQ